MVTVMSSPAENHDCKKNYKKGKNTETIRAGLLFY